MSEGMGSRSDSAEFDKSTEGAPVAAVESPKDCVSDGGGSSSSNGILTDDASWVSCQPKRKWNDDCPHDGSAINSDGASSGSYVHPETIVDFKNKQPMEFEIDFKKVPMLGDDALGSSNVLEVNDVASASRSSDQDAMIYDYESDDYGDYEDDNDEDYADDTDAVGDDNGYSWFTKFDGLDLPADVEATLPWLPPGVDTTGKWLPIGIEDTTQWLPTGVEATLPWMQMLDAPPKNKVADMSGGTVEDDVDEKYKAFKHFDTVIDHSDHYYKDNKYANISKEWSRRVQNEWKILQKDLPEAIYVRVYEERMDILRAAIMGPSGTPYHDGLFFFDVFLPCDYPKCPPLVHYHSGGMRLNPNLYNCGKVCLSLLGTWSGRGCEKWNPEHSTILQVLVSIQGLVLNEKPYFNEPGYSPLANTPQGEKRSHHYNEEAFLLSLKTMIYSLRRPPKHFQDLVAGHFRVHGKTILNAINAYMEGALVGSKIEDPKEDKNEEGDGSKAVKEPGINQIFKAGLEKLFEDLLMEFCVKGADCTYFLKQKAKGRVSKAALEERSSTLGGVD